MAWLLLGGVALGAGTYLGVKANELYDEMTKPIYDYFEKADKDAEQRELEIMRQDKIERTKEMHKNHDEIRNKYNLKKKNVIKLINNTSNVCDVIYVNHYNTKNSDDAITWAKQVVDIKYFEWGLYNKLNTKKVVMNTLSSIDLIKNEFDEYFIVLHVNNRYVVLDKDDLVNDNSEIKIKDKFDL
jgi:hypothetical protein